MKADRATRATVIIAAVFLAGCATSGRGSLSKSPFLTLPPSPEGQSELVLLAAIEGKVVDKNGCIVFEANGIDAAVIFAHGFSLDRKSSIISDGSERGSTLRLGRSGRFSGGVGTRIEAEAKLGFALPETCPANVVQIDEIK